MITVNNIISGIAGKLYDTFGPECEIYAEQVEQGLTEPCFTISSIKTGATRFFGERFFREHTFNVNYFPASVEEPPAEIRDVEEQLLIALEEITVDGDTVRGTGINGTVSDNVLVMTVRYNMFVYSDKEQADEMKTLEHTTEAKG